MSDSLTLRPIGYVRTAKQVKFQTLHQPDHADEEVNVLELLPDASFEQGLRDLEGFERVWLLWWFHRNSNWRPLVLPPRGPAKRRGVFATRSPHRPNPLGMTPVRLLGIEGRTLRLGACDLVDGTPVFDIKPYVPAYDAFSDSRAGWITEVDTLVNTPPAFRVVFSPHAEEQARWLRETHRVDFTERLVEILSRDPTPHRTRRIRKRRSGRLEIGCGSWRAEFSVEDHVVTVRMLEPGYPMRFLTRPGQSLPADCEAQIAFLQRWPETSYD